MKYTVNVQSPVDGDYSREWDEPMQAAEEAMDAFAGVCVERMKPGERMMVEIVRESS